LTTETTKPEATKAARKPRVKPLSKAKSTVEDGLKPRRIARAEKALDPDFSIERLQFLIVDALEDMKGQSISVFNTQALSDLFDRVVIASGTSNRQTRALANNVIDKVKKNGGKIYGLEGEDTGEWVLVDCGDIIVHIFQPVVRAHFRLEEIWGSSEIDLEEVKELGQKTRGRLPRSKPEKSDKTAKKVSRNKSDTKPQTA
jgi:ribosome-associated protein